MILAVVLLLLNALGITFSNVTFLILGIILLFVGGVLLLKESKSIQERKISFRRINNKGSI